MNVELSQASLPQLAHDSQERPQSLLDRTGAFLGFACAIHCLSVPFLIGVLPALGLGFVADERFEWLVLVLAAFVAFFSSRSGMRSHGRKAIVWGFGLTFLWLLGGHFLSPEGSFLHHLMSALGGFALFFMHLLNLKWARQAHQGACPLHHQHG